MRVTLIAHDIRSTHNVGAFFRTCDALGVEEIIFSGYTPYPQLEGDTRLPHFADKMTRQIHKTALGAESSVSYRRYNELSEALEALESENTVVVALEQFTGSLEPQQCVDQIKAKYPDQPIALIIGNEIHGVNKDVLSRADFIMEIPMSGTKESLNVSVATGIALFSLKYL